MEVKTVVALRKELSKLASEGAANEKLILVLERLRAAPMTREVLEESKVGVEVNRIRKSKATEREVADLATAILVKWKGLVVAGRAEAKRPTPSDEDTTEGRAEERREQTEVALGGWDKEGPSLLPRVKSAPTPLAITHLTGDAVRDKCFEMLLAALTADADDAKETGTLLLARAIEECLFAEFGSAGQPYKAKFRSKYLNLKDRNNAGLRRAILSGAVSAERFCAMSAAEMAPEERRREDGKLIEQNLREAKAAQDNEAETEQFKCGRCQQRRTKYYQLQTRSADEPMTTFVTCINCGNRWKFC